MTIIVKSYKQFMQLPDQEITELHTRMGYPHLGVFVADGSRRLSLAFSDAHPDSQEFYHLAASLPAKYIYQAIEVMFNHGLPTLMAPVLGRSLLIRGQDYINRTLLEGLAILFKSPEWKMLYRNLDIRVRVYGHPDCLIGTACEPALDWIAQTQQETATHTKHTLWYAIGESAVIGEEASNNAVRFFVEHDRQPSLEEQVQYYYGEKMPMVDFFIMTSKMSGMGALPSFLVNGDTELYFLPTVMSLTRKTYRQILFDLWFQRSELRQGLKGFSITKASRNALRQAYEDSVEQVIGIGSEIGRIWVMSPPKMKE